MIGRILCLDVGDVRIGIAASDLLGITAQGIETYTRTGDITVDAGYICNVAKKYDAKSIVIGLPKNMDGSEGFQAEKVKEFVEAVKTEYTGECFFFDERLTTVSAKRILHEMKADKKRVKGSVDKIAAVIILQSYLESVGA